MPTIDNFSIPDFICNDFLALINAAPAADIQALARMDPELARGIRPSAANVKIIRQRLILQLKDKGPLTKNLFYILRNSSFNLEFIAILSVQVLGLFGPDLAAVFGTAKTMGAMLVDERQPVRALAIDFLSAASNSPARRKASAGLKHLTSELDPFLGHIKNLLADGGPHDIVSAPVVDQKRGGCDNKRKINELTGELNREVRARQRLEKALNNKINKKDRQLVVLKDQVSREKGRRQELDREVKLLKRQLVRQVEQAEKKIERQVEQRMSSNVRSWLIEPQKIAAAVQKLSKDNGRDIKLRALSILREQEKLDRHYANRCVLRQRLRDLADLKEQVCQAGKESLNPLPELSVLNKELETEIRAVKKLLGEPAIEESWYLKLELKINQAATQSEFNAINRLLEQLTALDLLNNEAERLHNLYHNGLARFYEKYSPKLVTPGKSVNPLQLIQNWHNIKAPFVLVVDGYNVILSMSDIFGSDYEDDGKPGAASRRHLLLIIEEILHNSSCLAEVFFDGEEAGQRNFSPRVREVFSGGGSRAVPNRADRAIIDYLSSLPSGGWDIPRIVITDDRELQSQARRQQAQIMPLAQFAALIAKVDDE
jgi:molybdenum-dependent DNA-binding transcriptional regulator ModE